ncbi:zwei Ig domain protein zig-8-like [Limulus polyphemus]|uniref:Zwei Ig domain protein zig-8-like n=1 Tax=Limulus polyphemus TaxID=6850 RepID=A0ABM1SHC4_LIMPO|nr:zwei Ig domain protein zig-8-like [Limulus polyphemus]
MFTSIWSNWFVIGVYLQCLFSFHLALEDTNGTTDVITTKYASDDGVLPLEEYWSVGGYAIPITGNITMKDATCQLGQTAYLHCVVDNLGDKTVSWIRRKDFHVLTVGSDTYIADDRFQAVLIQAAKDWVLQIKFIQLSDAGLYECQISSDPKISHFFNLTVLVAETTIEGEAIRYVKTKSSINLTCVISNSPEPPVFVFWYHNQRMINYDSSRGKISVEKNSEDTAISTLYIKDAEPTDSGNYTCGPSNAGPTSVYVHVLNGEKSAAMQHDTSSSASSSSDTTTLLVKCIFVLLVVSFVRR